MSLDYETGVAISALLAIVRLAWGLAMRFTLIHKNMGRMGQRSSFVSGAWKFGGSWWWELPIAILLAAGFALLSWANLGLSAGFMFYHWLRSRWAPPQVREVAWRLMNLEMRSEDLFLQDLRFHNFSVGRAMTPAELQAREEFVADELAGAGRHDLLPALRGAVVAYATENKFVPPAMLSAAAAQDYGA